METEDEYDPNEELLVGKLHLMDDEATLKGLFYPVKLLRVGIRGNRLTARQLKTFKSWSKRTVS